MTRPYFFKSLEEQAGFELMAMTIGEVARRAQCAAPTIRYYEEIGLLRPVARGGNGRRSYGWPEVSRLQFIRRCRDLGFSVPDLRALLSVMDAADPSCLDARDLARTHLATIQARKAELEAVERTLLSVLSSCTDACDGGASADCTLLTDLTADAA